MQNRIQVAERFAHAFNNRRYAPNDVKDFVAANAVIAIPATGQEFHGPEGVEQFNGGWAQAFSDGQLGDIHSVDTGDYVETQFRGRGTYDGDFATPQGVVSGDGSRRIDMPFANRVWIDGDKITRVELHFEPGELFRQMGLD